MVSRVVQRLRKALSHGWRCVTARTPYRRSIRALGLALMPGRLIVRSGDRSGGWLGRLLGVHTCVLPEEGLIQMTVPGGDVLFTPAGADDGENWPRCWELLYGLWLECCVMDQYHFGDLLKPNMTVLDVGANVGAATLAASKWLGPGGSLVAIEPVPGNVNALRHCISANSLPVSHLLPLAIGRMDTNVTLHCGRTLTTVHTVVQSRSSETAPTINVEQRSIDSLMTDLEIAPDFIKIDVEGAELDVLAGGSRTLKQHRPIVVAAAYHEPEHPTLIRALFEETVPDYRYELRCAAYGAETEFVALPVERI